MTHEATNPKPPREIAVGDELPPLELPVTSTVIVAGAIVDKGDLFGIGGVAGPLLVENGADGQVGHVRSNPLISERKTAEPPDAGRSAL